MIYKRVHDTLLHEIVFFRAGRRSRCRRATGASEGMIYPQIAQIYADSGDPTASSRPNLR